MENKQEYKLTIGLEIHAELKTKTKMFCSCKNDPDEKRPNVNICPICLAHPGTLPVPNKEAVKHVLKVGLAIEGRINEVSEFDRKNYFYPDIPKAYQLSQYKYPFIVGGNLAGVAVTRIHLEEDTARSSHSGEGSLVDFNRAGVPLMELVTEPVIHGSKEAVEFGKELQLLLQYLGAAEANMEKGEIRFEANISISKTEKLGTKVEVKNLNSFRALEQAIEYEAVRQAEALDKGEKVVQETRGWDEDRQETFSQRSKEDSHDYRYFPDPDIAKLKVGEIPGFSNAELKSELKETPDKKRERFSTFGLDKNHIEFYILNPRLAGLFEEAVSHAAPADIKTLSNYIVNDIAALGEVSIDPQDIAKLASMITANQLSSRGAKEVIVRLAAGETGTESIAINKGLLQKSDAGELGQIVKQVIRENEKVVSEYKAGKVTALQFLVGQCMKLSKGSANPTIVREMLEKELV
jgi:aspartyl-tRNA(Asn)/glutamyl-tRNA(Gln) amidotransferase subunit B